VFLKTNKIVLNSNIINQTIKLRTSTYNVQESAVIVDNIIDVQCMFIYKCNASDRKEVILL